MLPIVLALLMSSTSSQWSGIRGAKPVAELLSSAPKLDEALQSRVNEPALLTAEYNFSISSTSGIYL